MNRKICLDRVLSLLIAAALVCGLISPALAASDPGASQEAGSSGSVVGGAYSEDPNAYEIYPVPHSVTYPGGQFTLTDEVNVVADEGVDTYTMEFLEDILTRFGRTMTTSAAAVDGKSNIVLAIDPTMTESEGHYTPYTLTAQNGTITITGMDTDCVYYGVATLQMMFTSFNGEKFLNVQIEDYSNTIFRGFVEGFYGPGFRSYADRESQMRSIRDVKGNMYVFAAKGDEYHGGSHWADEYPAEELAQIQRLVEVGKETKVHYTWSLHIGKSHALDNVTLGSELYTQQLNKITAKFQQLYDVGVRSFNILNDDYNSGTYEVQVQLLNDINAWLQGKGDCMPLIYCCAGYNTAWAGNGAELQALQALNDDIYLYWTGSDVNSPITQTSIDWPTEKANQPIVTWLNYPCSEHSGGRGIFLGNISHYVKDADGLTGQYGLLSNGMASPEANKVAYFQLCSWCWNRDNYTEYLDELWEDCFKYLQPEVYESYLTIARNVSNCPNSGRIPNGFPESEYIKDALAAVQTAVLNGASLDEIPEAQDLLDELDNILAAVADFRANCENAALKAELEPWLKSLTDVATAAIKGMKAADMLTDQDVSGAWNAFSEGAVALGKWDTYPSSNPDVSNNVKAGSLRLQPFANAVLDYVETAMALQFNPAGGLSGGQRTPIIRTAGTEQPNDANAQKMFDGVPTTYAIYDANQHVDDYIGVDLGEVKTVTSVDILQGQNDTHHDYFHKAVVEYSVDGDSWITLVTKVNSHHIAVDGLSIAARYVRMRLLEIGYQGPNGQHNTGENYYTYVREFTVTEEEAEPLYTNVDGVEAQGETAGGSHTLTIDNATLASGDYVGIRLPQLTGIQTVSTAGTLPSGVVLEYSVNGESWISGAPSQATLMGYVRLRATAAATLENVTLTVSEPVRTELSFVSDSGISLSSGSWSNVVDGDRSTSVYTGVRQAFGQYAIFDLGGVQPIYDVTIVVPENGLDIPHNVDFMVSNSLDGEWTAIKELRSSGTAETNNDITDDQYAIDPSDPTHRIFSFNANGVTGRYMKLAIANVVSWRYFYLNELEVNTTVPQEEPLTAVTATSGDAGGAVDGDLLTFFAPDSGASGAWTKLLQAPTALTGVTVLRGVDGASAAVEVQQGNAWKKVGTLTESATTIQLSEAGAITGLRITWTAADVPAIAEVILSGEDVPAGDAPALSPNIYEQPAQVEGVTVPNGTAVENIPLPDRVSVTMSSGAATSVPVVWSCENYVPTTAGEYTFTGDFAGTFNPGCFTLTANVTVNPAASTGETEEQNLALEQPAYASGREVDAQGPAQAVDGNPDTRWSSNKMKQKDDSTKIDTIENAVSWITVDLGTDVSSITQVKMQFHAKVWPLEYYVQAGGAGISYDGYTTPSTDTDYSATDTSNVTLSTGYTGTMHALDAAGWTTIYHGTRNADASDDTNPVITLGAGGDAFTADIPDGTQYLRIYFTKINPNALSGTGIGLKELTVSGTRFASAIDTNIASLAPAAATGTVGTAFDDLELPDTVTATLGDGSTVRVGVAWDDTGYDANATTAQTFTGTVTLPGGVTNTSSVTATLTLTLTLAPAPTIVSGSVQFTPASLSVANGTAFADLGLPIQGTATLTDGSTVDGTITWTEEDYDATQAGAQTIRGTFTSGGKTAGVTIQVTVADPEVIRHTVTFRSEGSADTTVEVVDGQAIGTLPTPTRNGYTFGGWFYGKPETRLTEEYVVNGGLTVTAKWTENPAPAPLDPVPLVPSTTTETKENEDGTTTTTVTDNKTGTITETTEKSDGSVEVVETKLDGTVTAVATDPDGGKVEKVTTPEKDVTITVTDRDGEVLAKVAIPAEMPRLDEDRKFVDVPDDNWAAGAINSMAALGVIQGKGDQIFDCKSPMKRGELTEVLYKMSNGKAGIASSFTDVAEGEWYADSVAWAAAVGVVNGVGENSFAPDRTITREELATMLVRYAKLLGMDTNADSAALDGFTDGSSTHGWAADAVAWCVKAGIIQGKGDGQLDPRSSASRAEVATMLQRFVDMVGGK